MLRESKYRNSSTLLKKRNRCENAQESRRKWRWRLNEPVDNDSSVIPQIVDRHCLCLFAPGTSQCRQQPLGAFLLSKAGASLQLNGKHQR